MKVTDMDRLGIRVEPAWPPGSRGMSQGIHGTRARGAAQLATERFEHVPEGIMKNHRYRPNVLQAVGRAQQYSRVQQGTAQLQHSSPVLGGLVLVLMNHKQ